VQGIAFVSGAACTQGVSWELWCRVAEAGAGFCVRMLFIDQFKQGKT